MTEQALIAVHLLTMLAGFLAAWGCICRLNAMHPRMVSSSVRVQYTALCSACVSIGLSWLIPWGIGALIAVIGVLVFLLLGSARWRNGVPDELRTDLGGFDDEPHIGHLEHKP